MIIDFHDKETEKIYRGEVSIKIPRDVQNVARRKLRMLDAAANLNDLRQPPGNRLEKLERDRAGQHSIRTNDQWRLCFIWQEDGTAQVEIVDYH